jgi:hypothetical protein
LEQVVAEQILQVEPREHVPERLRVGRGRRESAQIDQRVLVAPDGRRKFPLSELRRDDVLYAGGVLPLLLAVLFGYLCTWLGVPPVNPFG